MPTIEHRPVDRRVPESNWIIRHAKDITSQRGQDGMIRAVFDKIGVHNKTCCEFGAWDGVRYSNTHSLIQSEDWTGYLIEGNTRKYAELQRNHAGKKCVAINEMISFEGENTIDNVLARAGAPRDLDLMIIDIDGNDYHVWESMKDYRPRLLLVEFNPVIDNDVVFIQDRDMKTSQGNSLLALVELGKSKGYELVAASGDGFFVPREEFPKLGIQDNSIDALHYDGQYLTRILHGFDAKIWLAGHCGYLWKRRGEKIAPEHLPTDENGPAPTPE